MPSGDGSPARRMRNVLRHVQDHAQDDQSVDDASTPAVWSASLSPWASTSGVRRMSRTPVPRISRSFRNDLDDTMGALRNLESRVHATRPNMSQYRIPPPFVGRLDSTAAYMDSDEPMHRLAQINEDARSLLAQPLPNEDLTRRRPTDDNENGHRRKRRRIDSMSPPKAYYPITYGNEGQVVSGRLNMELVSSDGGILNSSATSINSRRSDPSPGMDDNEYTPTNVLRDDASVYCTRSSHCNMVFQHQGQTAFTLEKLVIKAPKVGYTDPVQEGLIFTALNQDDVFEATKRYHIWHYPTSRFGHLFKSHCSPRTRAPLGRRFTQSTPPPISHVRAERLLDEDQRIDTLGSSPHNDSISETSSLSLLTPDETTSSLSHGLGESEIGSLELNSDHIDVDELIRRGNLAAAARHPAEPLLHRARQSYNAYLRSSEMERPRSLNSPSLQERVSQVDAALDRLSSIDLASTAVTRPHASHIPVDVSADVPADVAAVLREFEIATVQIEDLRQSLRYGNERLRNIEVELEARGAQPLSLPAMQSGDSRDRVRRQLSRTTQQAADAQTASADTHSASPELLAPDARFSMHRHSPGRPPAPFERTSWFTRSEPRVAHRGDLPASHDKFRPRSVEMVDEHMSRPTEGLGSVLKSEMNDNGERIDYVHVRTTQIVQKDNEMTISFDPPISTKLILLKLWNPKACGDVDGKHNIDIESIQAIGWAGPRWFPAVGLR